MIRLGIVGNEHLSFGNRRSLPQTICGIYPFSFQFLFSLKKRPFKCTLVSGLRFRSMEGFTTLLISMESNASTSYEIS